MTRFLLGGVLVLLAAGAISLAAHPRKYHAAEPLDPAILSTQLEKSRGEMALP
jgi:hypothetical protein